MGSHCRHRRRVTDVTLLSQAREPRRTGSACLAALVAHGGALDAARRAYPGAPEPWVDLSTGINPLGYSVRDIPAEAFARLPTRAAVDALERTAATRYGVPENCEVVAAPGTQAIIQRLPVLCQGRDVRVLGPTYGEYARVYAETEARVRVVGATAALAGADVAIVVNPNNPDGRLLTPEVLRDLAGRVGTLVVDEAFMDALTPSASLVPRLVAGRTLVLRSFGKFYGLAGLRLGFAIASPARAEVLRRHLGPWAVAGPALAIGTRALADNAWHAATCRRLAADSARLGLLLGNAGGMPIGATPLFQLVEHPAASALFEALAARGILTRPFADAPTRLRFGLPGFEENWTRLTTALQAFR